MSAIYVDAPDKSSGKRVQHIHISYDGLGFIPLNELMKKETALPKSRRPLKTQGFHHFLILLFYDYPVLGRRAGLLSAPVPAESVEKAVGNAHRFF